MNNTLSYEEFRAVMELKRLVELWPDTLWLLGQSGSLNLLKAGDERPFYWNTYKLSCAVSNLHVFTQSFVVDPVFEKRYAKEASETQRALAFVRYLIGEIVNEVTDGDEFDFTKIIQGAKELGIDVEEEFLC